MTAEPAPMAEAKEQDPTKAAAEGTVAGAATAELHAAVSAEEVKPKGGDLYKKEAKEDAEREDASSGGAGTKLGEKCGSFREESNCLSDLKENEKKALLELRALLEEAIIGNKLFKKDAAITTVKEEVKKGDEEKKAEEAVATVVQENIEEKGSSRDEKEDNMAVVAGEKLAATETEKNPAMDVPNSDASSTEYKTVVDASAPIADALASEEKPVIDSEAPKSDAPASEEQPVIDSEAPKSDALDSEEKPVVDSEALKSDAPVSEEKPVADSEGPKSDAPAEKVKLSVEAPAVPISDGSAVEEKPAVEAPAAGEPEVEQQVDKDVSLWGVPLLPSKNEDSTNVVLLKFLRARDFRPKEALEMLSHTLQWRKSAGIDTILVDTSLGTGLDGAAYMDDGVDREGHPICYNVYGVFQDAELYQRTFGNEEKTEQFLRWRFQLMEKGIKRLDFRPGGTASILQVTDLKNAPGVSKKELRVAMKRAVALLQDNYPEFVARNIFINVPFWYYAFNALLSPFLTQRTKSKFVFARPSRVTETLLRYIPAEEIPVRYGGMRRDGDDEFRGDDGGVKEVAVRGSSTEIIELPAPEVGTTLLWDLTVLGWEVTYKEEFVPDDEGSYTVIVQKGRKMAATEGPVRNSFCSNEPGKVVLTIENNTFKRKKALYRYKIKDTTTTTCGNTART